MLRNPVIHPAFCADPEIIARRAKIIGDRLGHPNERIIGWCFSQWVLAVLWAIEDRLPFAPSWLDGPRAVEGLL